jgi:hypothetical protein
MQVPWLSDRGRPLYARAFALNDLPLDDWSVMVTVTVTVTVLVFIRLFLQLKSAR